MLLTVRWPNRLCGYNNTLAVKLLSQTLAKVYFFTLRTNLTN